MSMLAPACAQLAMAAMMIAEGRWMFAVMLLPGLFGCIASFMLMHARQQRPGPAMPGVSANGGATGGGPGWGPDKPVIPDLPTVPWPKLIGFDPDGTQWWRLIVHRWMLARECAESGGGTSQGVPIGMGEHGPVMMDLAAHGPHALVAGTTGSGKSVLLRQWCLALAAHYPPKALTMVFLDFKGGATFRGFEALPHTVGCVSDLDLEHAVRALNAIEAELKRRERLVAEAGGGQIDDLPSPPPRLLVVVDEFNALKEQLPDAMDRLTRLASLGRSLGMNLVACTQHPMGQVSAAMKANIAVNLCMRVRDDLQSMSMLGTKAASLIPSTSPGMGYRHDGDTLAAFRCAAPMDATPMVQAVADAARFCGCDAGRLLFSQPLPEYLPAPADPAGFASPQAVRIGAWDDGVALHPCDIPLDGGSIVVIGDARRGKTTVLEGIGRRLKAAGIPCAVSIEEARAMQDEHRPIRVALVDDAEPMVDPLSQDPRRAVFERLQRDPAVTLVYALSSARRIGDASRITMRIVFPGGDRTADLLAGIPADVLARLGPDATRIPGRAVAVSRGVANPLQICDR